MCLGPGLGGPSLAACVCLRTHGREPGSSAACAQLLEERAAAAPALLPGESHSEEPGAPQYTGSQRDATETL